MFYTSFGHEKISSYISQKASKALGREVELKIEEMSLSPSHLDATIMIDDRLKTKVKGFFYPFLGTYDIDYRLMGEYAGKVDINGTIEGKKEDFQIMGKGRALDGEVSFSGHYEPKAQKDIKVVLQEVSGAKLFLLLGRKPIFAGKVSLKADIPLYAAFEKYGDISIKTGRGGVYLKNIKALYGVQLPDDFTFSSHGDIHLEKGKHTFQGLVVSSIGEIEIKEGTLIEENKKIEAKYHLQIKDLATLAFVTKKRYAGEFVAKGTFLYHDGLRFDGESDSLGGKLSYSYEKEKISGVLETVSLSKLFKAMAYPPIMIGDINGKASYSLADKIAVINIKSREMHFQDNRMVRKIYRASGVDFSKELFTSTYFASSVEEGIVSYDFKAENRKSYLAISNAKMDAMANTIDADFDLKMQEEELSGKIYGSLKAPKIDLNIGKFLEFKAKKEIDEFFGKGTSKNVKKNVKGLLKSFFK